MADSDQQEGFALPAPSGWVARGAEAFDPPPLVAPAVIPPAPSPNVAIKIKIMALLDQIV